MNSFDNSKSGSAVFVVLVLAIAIDTAEFVLQFLKLTHYNNIVFY